MKKLLIRISIVITIAVFILAVRIFLFNINNFKKDSIHYLPLNNIANSECFRAKMDHLVKSDNFRKCTFLVTGSSMSLNNISGQIINERTNECVYNFSSWGIKPAQLNECLRLLDLKKVKHILMAFNNCDFGNNEFEIDYKAFNWYTNGNLAEQVWSCISKFNINTFSHDCRYRNEFSTIDNAYESLKFDEFGSALVRNHNFVYNNKRWNLCSDTSGFSIFLNYITGINTICNQNNIRFTLVYLPSRPNSLSEKNIIQNKNVSKVLAAQFGRSFIDMHNVQIPSEQYTDITHLFKNGAERITNIILDSLCAKP